MLFSGFLQTAAYKNLKGVNGLEGWRWLMIICFIITVPIAIANFVFLLDMPWQAKANWMFTEAEIELANTRLKKEGRAPAEKITVAKVRILARVAARWNSPIASTAEKNILILACLGLTMALCHLEQLWWIVCIVFLGALDRLLMPVHGS